MGSEGTRTVVLVGRTGNGKSATANTILGKKKAFLSRLSSGGVTRTCEQQSVVVGGQKINVIDTPGLFDLSADPEFISKEITKCISLARDGIHAFLLVLSVKNRFTQEEEGAFRSLQNLFGDRITDYMVVVFTYGDQLEEDEKLDDYLGYGCPKPLKEILSMADNRKVLFDNKTKDEAQRSQQVMTLLNLVNKVTAQNGGKPYTNEFFTEVQKGASELRNRQEEAVAKGYSEQQIAGMKKEMQKEFDEKLELVTSQLEWKVRNLEQQLVNQRQPEEKKRKDPCNIL